MRSGGQAAPSRKAFSHAGLPIRRRAAATRGSACWRASRNEAPPRLFHKGELADSTNLSQEVRDAIASPQQKVVGVVYNAVDDHLSGPDQLHQRWALEDLRLMLPLLREAREARRYPNSIWLSWADR